MSLPFNIKFTIFDENKPLTQKQINIRNNLIDSNNIDNDMKKILKNIINLGRKSGIRRSWKTIFILKSKTLQKVI